MIIKHSFTSILIALTLAWTGILRADDLAKASQNPIGDMISLPFELWHYDGMPGDSSATALMLKPVLPVNLGRINQGSDSSFRLLSGNDRLQHFDRVGRRPHGLLPPSEPYVTVSRHTAQAFTKATPVGRPDGCTSCGQ